MSASQNSPVYNEFNIMSNNSGPDCDVEKYRTIKSILAVDVSTK